MYVANDRNANLNVALSATDPTEARRQRGKHIADAARIVRAKGNEERWIVPSQTGQTKYTVNCVGESPVCECNDFVTRSLPCKHIYAVEFVKAREADPDHVPEVVPLTVKLPLRTCAPRPTFKQDWPAYNAAQINEKAKFQELLAELCRGVPEPARPHEGKKGGRPPVAMADRAFACAFKVYTTISGRRASSDMREARDKGHLDQAPHYSRVARFLEDPAMTAILMSLIAESAKPLRSIESDFIIDSSGFATSRFVKWFDHKYGVVKHKYDWVKVSVCTGKTTNVITAVEIDERYAADCPKFAGLLNSTVAGGFKLREVSADSAYLSYENVELVATHGGTPYIAFKANTTGDQGGALARMFHLFNFNRDDYLKHYHKRSNVESTFSMMKAKFGDSLRSKTDTAMVNEELCKVLCHNLAVLIGSIYELGVEATFWKTEPSSTAERNDLNTIMDDTVEAMAWF